MSKHTEVDEKPVTMSKHTEVDEKPEKLEKKKLIRVQGYSNYEYKLVGTTGFYYALVSSPEHGRKQVTRFVSCREYLNKSVYESIVSGIQIDFSKLRLLIYGGFPDREIKNEKELDEFKNKLFNGKACLNVLEELAGWQKSKITTVIHPETKHSWLITGPKEWMSQPQLLSLASWILRLAARSEPINTDNFDTFEKNLENLHNASVLNTYDNTTYLNAFWPKLYILMKFHDQIWEDIDIKKAWTPPGVAASNFGVLSGLLTFIRDPVDELNRLSTYSIEARNKFEELCKKHLPRVK